MTQSEVNGLKSIVSILKSRLEKATDKGEEISCGLIGTEGYIEEESLGEALMGIDKMMTLYKELDEYLTDLGDCICDLEDALDSAEITE
jgi:hypothetical protein